MSVIVQYFVIITHIIIIASAFKISSKSDDISTEIVQTDNKTQPQQIHLSLGDNPTQMVATWSTMSPTDTIVRYGVGQLVTVHMGTMTNFSNGVNHDQYIHSAIMDQLTPNTSYIYQVGSGNPNEMSKIYNFTTTPIGNNWSPRFCVYGDLGFINPQSYSRILSDVNKGMYDMIIHVGDFAYDLDSNFGDMGDKFMRLMEPIAARLPYMTSPGNHENAGNFSNYKNRFRMPNNDNQNMFYSYNVGPIHFISISTEYYFYVNYGLMQLLNQYKWLAEELKTANLPENRAKQPWIIVLGHRPLYCTNSDGNDCGIAADWLRYGVPFIHLLGIEDLLYLNGVDLAIWAHEHTYERMWPVYQEKVVNSSTPGQPYFNPKATVHIVSGSAGCQEDHDEFPQVEKDYSAFHSTDYGYSRMTVYNSTHLYFEQVSDDQKGKIIDQIWLIKTKHGSFLND
uniref:Purple acid phosphatase n=1 Tax=Dugesia japonica TaxID=6161 RepID=A0A6B9CVW7_DUGJA|nr:acid phosphatase type 7A [Dugesia japonica]